MTSQNRQYNGPTFSGNIDQSSTTPVYNLPTTNVLRPGVVNPSGISCLNIIGGFAVVIDASGLVNTQTLLIVATGGIAASVQLNNGGTIAGQSVYTLRAGETLSLQFDGTNLN